MLLLRHGIENRGYRYLCLKQLRGIGLDLKLRHATALQHHHRHAVNPLQPRLDRVVGQFPKLRLLIVSDVRL